MSEYKVIEDPRSELWDSFLDSHSLGNLWQTIDYGDIMRKYYPHTRTSRLAFTYDGILEGVVQCIYWKYLGFGTTMTVREGPLMSAETMDRSDLFNSIIHAIENVGIRHRIMRVRVMWPSNFGYTEILGNMGYELDGKTSSYSVDLSGGADQVWMKIAGTKRKNVRKAISRGVEFIESNDIDDIKGFYAIHEEAAKRHSFVPPSISWFQTIWESRRQKDASKVFFARWNGRNYSSVFVTMHGKTIYALGAGSLRKGQELRPTDFLHWRIMQWGSERGFSRYNMGDLKYGEQEGPPEKTSPTWGIWRWKKDWNGEADPIHIFTKSISKHRLIQGVYNKLTK